MSPFGGLCLWVGADSLLDDGPLVLHLPFMFELGAFSFHLFARVSQYCMSKDL
jgi:hypothetical protein